MAAKTRVKLKKTVTANKPQIFVPGAKLKSEEFAKTLTWNKDGSVSCVCVIDTTKLKWLDDLVTLKECLHAVSASAEDRYGFDSFVDDLFSKEILEKNGYTIDCQPQRDNEINQLSNGLPSDTAPEFDVIGVNNKFVTVRMTVCFLGIARWIYNTTVDYAVKLCRDGFDKLTKNQKNVVSNMLDAYCANIISPEMYAWDSFEEQIAIDARNQHAQLFDVFRLPFVPADWYKTQRVTTKKLETFYAKKAAERKAADEEKRKLARLEKP
jgi:hypothetical protein